MKPAFVKQAEEDLERIENRISFVKKKLRSTENLPEGTLVANIRSYTNIKYYLNVVKNHKHIRKYLGPADNKIVMMKKIRKFNQVLLRVLEHNRKILISAISQYNDYSAESIRKRLPMSYKELPDICYEDEQLNAIRRELRRTYSRNTYKLPSNPNIACDGTECRSKGEAIIYDEIYFSGLPVQYDSIHTFTDSSRHTHTLSPDFYFMCKDSTELVWEHFGMLDDEDYSSTKWTRILEYLQCGFVMGDTLIVTSDNLEHHTDGKMILDTIMRIKCRINGNYE